MSALSEQQLAAIRALLTAAQDIEGMCARRPDMVRDHFGLYGEETLAALVIGVREYVPVLLAEAMSQADDPFAEPKRGQAAVLNRAAAEIEARCPEGLAENRFDLCLCGAAEELRNMAEAAMKTGGAS